MGFLTVIVVAVVCLLGGVVFGWLIARSRSTPARDANGPNRWKADADAVPVNASPEEFAIALRNLLDERTDVSLVAIYAGRGDDESLWAAWRDGSARSGGLPAAAPGTLVLQLPGPTLVDIGELSRGLRPGLPPADGLDDSIAANSADWERGWRTH